MSKINGLEKLNTWDNRSSFQYNGSAQEGTLIFYRKWWKTNVSAGTYEKMLQHFGKRIVDCGTSRTAPQLGSLGEWLKENVSKTATASYVGAILVSEGYAEKNGSRIEFLGW